MQKEQKTTIKVFGAMNAPEKKMLDTLSVADVPLDAIKANMEKVLKDTTEMLTYVKEKLGKCKIDHVDLTLGIAVDGSVGIFGSGVTAGAEAGMTVQIKFE